MGRYSRVDGKKSSSSFGLTITIVLIVSLSLVGAWMFMSSWSAPTESIDFSSSQTTTKDVETTSKSDFTNEKNEETEVVTERNQEKVEERKEFEELPLLKGLQGRAWKQLGSSGSGNHFAEFGIVEVNEKDQVLAIEPGKYLGLLSHSGSRALGANIANHYTKLATSKRRLPHDAKNLAWLNLDEEEGIEIQKRETATRLCPGPFARGSLRSRQVNARRGLAGARG